ncbi:MAG: presqualene diphosphate synthase HpnD [Alphaproteobacteria bacterium]|nr:presqualene diphosphate synthase HpnD [Alphaproteobacteria bacterium]
MTSPEIAAVEAKAKGSSFYAAMKLMPRDEREAMFAIYAFCRMVDDIADDGEGSREERFARLAAWRRDLDALYRGEPATLGGFLKDAVTRYGLRKDDFLAVVDGMEMDVHADIVAPELSILDLYCDRVASAVGRLSIKVFGMEEGPGFALAHHLGRALQLTNILRDIDEDWRIGRLYLPRDYLDGAASADDPRIDGAARRVATLAHEHYEKADAIMRGKPKGRTRTPKLMGAVYAQILRAMEREGWAPPRKRVSLPKSQLAMIVLRSGLLG